MMWNCRNKHLLPPVAAAAALLAAYAISDQSSAAGFINIDCGKEKIYNYTDPDTGLNYTSDFKYIDTGEIHDAGFSSISPRNFEQSRDLRSFPRGIRNCYTIKGVEKGSKYLVKASFMYGNYDRKNSTPKFDLYLGVNFWTTVNLPEVSSNYIEEMITVTTSDQVSVCLINTGRGTPFISALELRPLPPDLYDTHLKSEETSKELVLHTRTNFRGHFLRYPQDRYDRSWFGNLEDNFKTLTATSPVESTTKTYEPPSEVMKTAIYSTSFYSYYWTPSGFDLQQNSGFLVILHFAELQELQGNETRIFNITVDNDRIVTKHFSPSYLVTTSLYKSDPSTIQEFSLQTINKSTLPPIINAAEVFAVRNKIETETSNDDVDAATTIKVKYEVQKNWVGDPCSPKNFKWDGLNCSINNFTNFRIISINLSSSRLTGEISTSFAKLSELQYLDLSGNRLSGYVPQVLLDRSATGSLTLRIDNSKKKSASKIVIAVTVSIASVVLLGLLAIFILKRKKDPGIPNASNRGSSQFVLDELATDYFDEEIGRGSNQFTTGDLVKITHNFGEEIGRGGFGSVYRGVLDGTEVAVKKLSRSSAQGPEQFKTEVQLLTNIHHRNLVSLVGFCNERGDLALVYEYMAQGSLQDHLTGKVSTTLSWVKRLQISLGAAKGLEYIHVGCQPAIVHRDVKTSNILLNKNLEAKFSDFGLSKLFQTDFYTHISTVPVGTVGYIDPAYYETGTLDEKSDVYSFGVVLLELITGRPAIVIGNSGNINLIKWVRMRVERGQIDEIIDERISENCDINSVGKIIETAMECVSPEPVQRPTMTNILNILAECLEMAITDATESNMNMSPMPLLPSTR